MLNISEKTGIIKLLSSFHGPIHHFLLWPLTSRVPALVGRLTGITTSVAAILSHQLQFRKQRNSMGTRNRLKFRCVTSRLKRVARTFPPTISHHQIPRLCFLHDVWSSMASSKWVSIFPHCHLKESGIQFTVLCTKRNVYDPMGQIWSSLPFGSQFNSVYSPTAVHSAM